jgi:hypothetical protein
VVEIVSSTPPIVPVAALYFKALYWKRSLVFSAVAAHVTQV